MTALNLHPRRRSRPSGATRGPRHHLAPVETIEHVECQAKASAQRVSCGKCGKTFSAGAVVTDPKAHFDEAKQCWLVGRRLYCDHCNHLVYWLQRVEGVDQVGPDEFKFKITDHVESGPGYVRAGWAIAKFLKEHPAAAGVSQKF